MNKLLAIVASSALLALASPAAAVSPATQATANAKIYKPLTISKVQNLDFGVIVLGSGAWSGEVVSISQAGALTCGGGTNLTCSGSPQVAKYHLVLATGHNTPEEDLLLIRNARTQGVRNIVVTHAMMAPIHMSIPQMKEAAGLGALIEFVYNGLIGHYKEFTFADYARAIRAVGPEHCVLSSDMGQPANPSHPDGLQLFFEGLKKAGITDAEIAIMAKQNPARLLGLAPFQIVLERLIHGSKIVFANYGGWRTCGRCKRAAGIAAQDNRHSNRRGLLR